MFQVLIRFYKEFVITKLPRQSTVERKPNIGHLPVRAFRDLKGLSLPGRPSP
jgi:hypothetical protein